MRAHEARQAPVVSLGNRIRLWGTVDDNNGRDALGELWGRLVAGREFRLPIGVAGRYYDGLQDGAGCEIRSLSQPSSAVRFGSASGLNRATAVVVEPPHKPGFTTRPHLPSQSCSSCAFCAETCVRCKEIDRVNLQRANNLHASRGPVGAARYQSRAARPS